MQINVIAQITSIERLANNKNMKLQRPRRPIFKRTRIRNLIVWYLILLVGIIILVWKMPAIVSRL